MITTLCLLQLIAFEIWYVTSAQVKTETGRAYVTYIQGRKRQSRVIGLTLLVATTMAFIAKWGCMSGISAAIVSLMTIGSLVVLLHPFRYLNERTGALLFALLLLLEFLI